MIVRQVGIKVIGMRRLTPTGLKTTPSAIATNGSGAPSSAFSIGPSQERLKELLDYDPITGDFTWKIALSRAIKVGDTAGTMDNEYIKINIGGTSYQAHVLAWFYVYGKWIMPDHKDRCRYNNAINNLRESTYQLNAANRSFSGNNSGAKGVYYRNGKYEVGIKVNQKRIYLGLRDTLEEAKELYAQAATKYFGEYACF